MRKSSPPPRRKSPQSPSITNRPKSAPLPRRVSPSQTQQSLLRPFLTSPRQSPQKANLSSIPDDLRLRVLDYVLKSETKHTPLTPLTTLNNELIEKLSILAINKSFKETLKPYMKPYLENIVSIVLRNIEITKDILCVLQMTDSKKIGKIILEGISFDSPETLKKFLEFFSENNMIVALVLDNIKGDFNNFLKGLKSFKNLVFLEINNSNLPNDAFNTFIKRLTNDLKSLSYLSFTNNTVGSNYDTLFTVNKDNIIKVNKIDYNLYMSYKYGDWSMKIKKKDSNTFSNRIQSNISDNISVSGYTINRIKDYPTELSFKLKD
jgi:Ca2+-binding RTX toxin-like protein